MIGGDGFVALMERALSTHDSLVLKVLRNISLHDDDKIKMLFAPYVASLVKLAKITKASAVLVEALGILGNCVIEGFDFAKLISDFGLVDFLHKYLQPGSSEDDVVLEVVIFIGTLMSDPDVPEVLSQTPLIRDLFKVLQEQQDDPEITLQLLFVFLKLLDNEETKPAVVNQTQIIYYLVDYLYCDRAEIKRIADQCLDIISEYDGDWAAKIRQKKFEMHNIEWVQHCEEDDEDQGYNDADNIDWETEGGQLRRQKGFAVHDFDEFDDDAWNEDRFAY
eukprot:comp18370_c0_seq1/m.32704 comp18370_c0_seq1/g.32704  ORF comp18370_c0_seq1/g.32704 comp18370_c0_seq1/m.32704 type:complete len:278 (-) comp18370_c0_seq1:67-900(-)